MSSHGPIVIAGFGLRLPGGVSTVSQAYDAFRSGESRLSSTAGQTLRLWSRTAEGLPLNAGLVDGPDMFDPAFFGISPRVAQEMDPQQRWALMCATEAIRESGIPLKVLAFISPCSAIPCSSLLRVVVLYFRLPDSSNMPHWCPGWCW
jgi:acyl transferase domain-containing protein